MERANYNLQEQQWRTFKISQAALHELSWTIVIEGKHRYKREKRESRSWIKRGKARTRKQLRWKRARKRGRMRMREREREKGGLILSETLSGLEFAFRIVPTSSWQIDVADSPPTKVIPAEMEGEGEKVSPRDFARRMIRSSREVNLDAVAHFSLAQLISTTCIGEISSSKRRNVAVASLRRTRFS